METIIFNDLKGVLVFASLGTKILETSIFESSLFLYQGLQKQFEYFNVTWLLACPHYYKERGQMETIADVTDPSLTWWDFTDMRYICTVLTTFLHITTKILDLKYRAIKLNALEIPVLHPHFLCQIHEEIELLFPLLGCDSNDNFVTFSFSFKYKNVPSSIVQFVHRSPRQFQNFVFLILF